MMMKKKFSHTCANRKDVGLYITRTHPYLQTIKVLQCCSENKGADQLVGYREVDLRLCFRICEIPVFPERGFSMFKSKNKKVMYTPASHSFTICKCG